jgi:excisionase family DNA binding protein
MDTNLEPRLLRISEVCVLLGISRSAVYREIEAKRIRAVGIGKRSKRVSREEIERYITKKTEEISDK